MRSKTNAETLRELRIKAAAAGFCYQCRCRPKSGDRNYCAECLLRNEKQKQKQHKRGNCVRCGQRRGRRGRYCKACLVKVNAAGRARQRDRVYGKGLCARCRQPQVPGFTMCAPCLDQERRRFNSPDSPPRKCSVCGSTDHIRKLHERVPA